MRATALKLKLAQKVESCTRAAKEMLQVRLKMLHQLAQSASLCQQEMKTESLR